MWLMPRGVDNQSRALLCDGTACESFELQEGETLAAPHGPGLCYRGRGLALQDLRKHLKIFKHTERIVQWTHTCLLFVAT